MRGAWVQSYDGSAEHICISGDPQVEEQWYDTYGCRYSGETCTLRDGGDGGIWDCPVGTANRANVSTPVPTTGGGNGQRSHLPWYIAGGVIAAGIIGIGIYILYDTRRTT
jgi:hypothetical protein